MKRYITSDKIGEVCQFLFNKGINFNVGQDAIAIRKGSFDYEYIPIYSKISLDELVNELVDIVKTTED